MFFKKISKWIHIKKKTSENVSKTGISKTKITGYLKIIANVILYSRIVIVFFKKMQMEKRFNYHESFEHYCGNCSQQIKIQKILEVKIVLKFKGDIYKLKRKPMSQHKISSTNLRSIKLTILSECLKLGMFAGQLKIREYIRYPSKWMETVTDQLFTNPRRDTGKRHKQAFQRINLQIICMWKDVASVEM